MSGSPREFARRKWRWYRSLPLGDQFKVEWIALLVVYVVTCAAISIAAVLS